MLDTDGWTLAEPPARWRRLGKIFERGDPGTFDSDVTGDPCIVWDEEFETHRMLYFAMGSGHTCGNGQAVAGGKTEFCAGAWEKLGPLGYTNPDALGDGTHKPWILMDPHRPNMPAHIDGRYWLFTVSFHDGHKVIQVAKADRLEGPWQVQPKPVVGVGDGDAFDALHADAVTAYWFEERGEILIFYMGYPMKPQSDRPWTPYGSCSAVAVMAPDDETASKVGPDLPPAADDSHWASGYLGGRQILPRKGGGWWALLNASPTPPVPLDEERRVREPAPSLGGWAYTEEAWPVGGWRYEPRPIEWIEEIPEEARAAGEGVNLWRHHLLVLPDGRLCLYYNTGPYGQERMFGKLAE